MIFGISMALALGIKAPFEYSVFAAAAAAFSLAVTAADHNQEIREEVIMNHKFDSGTCWPSILTRGGDQ